MLRLLSAPPRVRQTTLEVSRRCLRQNFNSLVRSAAGKNLLVVLKSNAYGHSLVDVAKILETERGGLHGIGLANVEEGAELRAAGIKAPIYILSGIQEWNQDLDIYMRHLRLIPVLSSLRTLQQMDKVLRKNRKAIALHLKLNTGMNRLGLEPEELGEALRLVQKNPFLKVEGLISHFAASENRHSSLTKQQIKKFQALLKDAVATNGPFRFVHIENSAGLQNQLFPQANVARVGINLFGMENAALAPVARWQAQIYQTRQLRKGASVGYGPHFKAKCAMRMAVLGVGYGDGYPRSLSNRASVLIRGQRCPVIGAISMDLTAVDISECPELDLKRDRAVLLGQDGKERIRAEDLAKLAQTISWEITTRISARVPRIIV